MGCADLFAYMYGGGLNHSPKNSNWVARDKFVLSAGHGSAALYASLALSGFDLTIEDVSKFRQLNSKTPGHPEYGHTDGVETTTGPLGQGLATAVGMALANKRLSEKFNNDWCDFSANVVCLVGDGCIMEGISSEASSFAGHLSLDNLIVVYDANDICLDGPIDECLTENVAKRYESYGWSVITIDGHSFDDIHQAMGWAKESNTPSLIIMKTIIGKGAPDVEGTSDAHGKPLGTDQGNLTKQFYGIPESPQFFVPSEVREYFANLNDLQNSYYQSWMAKFNEWASSDPTAFAEYSDWFSNYSFVDIVSFINEIEIKPNVATRVSSSQVLNQLSLKLSCIVGGSADLSCSDNTAIKQSGVVSRHAYSESNIKYGVREFAMASIASGLALSNFVRPFIGTFLIFSDYMRNAIRLASLMNIPVVYQLTHDSVFLGEDGPTHQPVEQLPSLRAIPNLRVCRPADEKEVSTAWALALSSQSPMAIILSRQKIASLNETSAENAAKGGYVLYENSRAVLTIFSSGSECSLALDVCKSLNDKIPCRVVSMFSWELFESQSVEYRSSVCGNTQFKVSIEAASTMGWDKYVGSNGLKIGIDDFGLSAPESDIRSSFGFTVDCLVETITTFVSK